MSKKSLSRFIFALAFPAFLVGAAQAQSIRIATEPFVDKPLLPFAPAKNSAPSSPPSVLLPPASIPTFQLEKGKRVDEQLLAFGRRSGWTLVWQSSDYVLDQPMVLENDFEAAIISFLKGANEAGFPLRAVFYRGNKTVRITEN